MDKSKQMVNSQVVEHSNWLTSALLVDMTCAFRMTTNNRMTNGTAMVALWRDFRGEACCIVCGAVAMWDIMLHPVQD